HPRLQLLQPRLRPVAARQYDALYAVAVAGDIVLRHEGTHGVAEEKDRHPRMPGRDLPVEAIKIADGGAPARLIAKMPGRRAIRYIQPVPAMIRGIGNIAKGVQHLGEARISPAMFGHTVGDLHGRLWSLYLEPAPGLQPGAALAFKTEQLAHPDAPLAASY